MITLGTIFILIMVYANFERWRGHLDSNRGLLWVLMLAFPFPYIANTLGWMTTELGRQPCRRQFTNVVDWFFRPNATGASRSVRISSIFS